MDFNALVPELAVSDWRKSRDFYCNLIGWSVAYDRPEEGFAFLVLLDNSKCYSDLCASEKTRGAVGTAQLMIDQIGTGRDFDIPNAPREHPFGRGLNLQIRVSSLDKILERLEHAGIPLYLPPEDKWYRSGNIELGNRQFVVADPDGYLLRIFEELGTRPYRIEDVQDNDRTSDSRR